jgi:hypothetical protein
MLCHYYAYESSLKALASPRAQHQLYKYNIYNFLQQLCHSNTLHLVGSTPCLHTIIRNEVHLSASNASDCCSAFQRFTPLHFSRPVFPYSVLDRHLLAYLQLSGGRVDGPHSLQQSPTSTSLTADSEIPSNPATRIFNSLSSAMRLSTLISSIVMHYVTING